MTDFFREVDEDFRRDKAIELLKRYQNWLIAAALLVILGTAAWRVYVYYQTAADEAAGGRYETALRELQDGKVDPSIAAFEAIGRDGPKGYAALSRLIAADAVAVKDPKAGLTAYDALISDPAYNGHLKDIAQLRAAYLRLDTDAPKEFQQRYASLAASSQPYRNSMRELLAVAALKGGDFPAASRWLDEIVADPAATEGLRRRADAFLAVVQAGKLPEK
ncbi:MAG TPA: tetratricopeptide repeat protein [Methylovirgula sp.]|jgi:hypothetical protein|nr:tetratricopeptide repeat protein [Methylovirgula sp.]